MFNYKSLDDLKKDIDRLGLPLSVSEDFECFKSSVSLMGAFIPNSLVALPMEGGDATAEGEPTEMTFRKYERTARGGAGLIWLEAVSVCEDGKSNQKQLFINEKNLPKFKELKERIVAAAKERHGEDYTPVVVIQLNHSGRYSKPYGERKPVIASHKKELDAKIGLDENYPLVTDEYLENLEEAFVKAAELSKEAGFDGVDIKACHGYLLSELLSCFDRDGKYGGCFENRTRFMFNVIDKMKAKIKDDNFILCSRLNLYDALPQSKGFGQNDKNELDLTETIKLVELLAERGVELIGATMGNPYFIPHINKPSDKSPYTPPETPLESAFRLIDGVAKVQQAVPKSKIVGVGYSWFREYAPYIGAAVLNENKASLIGFGRECIAYPEFCNDILEKGTMSRSNVCVSCNKCSDLKRDIGTCGCVVRDNEVYLPLYRETYSKGC